MADKIPLKLENGKLKQFGTGDTISATIAPGSGGASDPSYSPGSFTVATETQRFAPHRLKVTTTQRITIQGTGRLSVLN